MFGNPTEIALLVAAAAILFGADRIPKLARGLGQAKKEFQAGQIEADIEADRLRAEARARAEAGAPAVEGTSQPGAVAEAAPAQTAPAGTATSTAAPATANRVQQD